MAHGNQITLNVLTDLIPEHNEINVIRQPPDTHTVAIISYGGRWRSTESFTRQGKFSALIRNPAGDTSGLCTYFNLSSTPDQDSIFFEFLGNKKTTLLTYYYENGNFNEASFQLHELGFDTSEAYHRYEVHWNQQCIEWFVDGRSIRQEIFVDGRSIRRESWNQRQPMYVYGSMEEPANRDINDLNWPGEYNGPPRNLKCEYRDIQVTI